MSYPIITSAVRRATIEAIDDEVARARAKFPGNQHLMAALTEEVGELAEALLKSEHPAAPESHPEIVAARGTSALRRRIREEAIQVACVAIRIIEEGDAEFPNSVPVKETPDA